MKYWRGYLTAGIFAAFTWAMTRLGDSLGDLVDMVYPYLTREIQTILAQWTGGVDFCVWQVAALVLIALLLCSIVLMLVLRWNPIQWFGWVLAAVSIGVFLHTGIWGLNYYAGPLADDIRLEVTEDYSLVDLEEATAYYRDLANELAVQLPRDENGEPIYADFDELANQAGEGFHVLTYEKSGSVFAGSALPVKKLAWSEMYTSMGITGITMPLTGESAVNPDIPAVSLPFTMCHEMAHRMCIAPERDANFAAYLACRENSDVEFRYSAYFMAYRYCYSALAGVGVTDAAEAAARVRSGECAELTHDMAAYDNYFRSRRNETATKVATTANDTYIKASGDSSGTRSYGEVCDLLVSNYIQEVVAPAQAEEEERFNPYDPSQVDLTGLANAPAETEDGGE